ncbi:primosomal replication protein N [Calidifontimicrobium sp. SYSU G02091]|uniref:primosomal replication protein N n=1 Tax=Calidifontimicrobium sp. SYSU G02091 TaxID=2926421 RepID=UPI001F53A0CA|nr:primosomal replication protein N [Calidifontimicrobium sp. SYSU G02091]MCI1192031.1 primosomal replication protein N [Calidifontimicrobium sp. SYSU G02091]
MNRLLLQAQLVERSALRYTPAGTPACDLGLKHESQVTEAGHPRRVALEVRAVALGELAQRLAQLPLGTEAGFAGFLASARNGRGVVFHVTTVDGIE